MSTHNNINNNSPLLLSRENLEKLMMRQQTGPELRFRSPTLSLVVCLRNCLIISEVRSRR